MKKLGIIGGAGPMASSLFYDTLVRETYLTKCPMPETLLINYPFSRGLTLEEQKKNQRCIQKELMHCLKQLERGGAEVGILVCNTLHLYLLPLKDYSIRFFSIPSFLLNEVQKNKHRRLLLLGTQCTSCSSLYRQDKVELLLPSNKDQSLLDGLIDRILEGDILKEDSLMLTSIIASFAGQIDGVILGCTDLPVLHHYHPIASDATIYDSVKLSAKLLLGHL